MSLSASLTLSLMAILACAIPAMRGRESTRCSLCEANDGDRADVLEARIRATPSFAMPN
jgi:hypothetical protein